MAWRPGSSDGNTAWVSFKHLRNGSVPAVWRRNALWAVKWVICLRGSCRQQRSSALMAVQQSDTDKVDLGPLNTLTSDSQHHQSLLSGWRRRSKAVSWTWPRCGVTLSPRRRSVNPKLKTPLSGVGHASAGSSARQLCKSPPSFQLHWGKQYGHCLGTDHPACGSHTPPALAAAAAWDQMLWSRLN